jgi:hypothetical protein
MGIRMESEPELTHLVRLEWHEAAVGVGMTLADDCASTNALQRATSPVRLPGG